MKPERRPNAVMLYESLKFSPLYRENTAIKGSVAIFFAGNREIQGKRRGQVNSK
jgi:hypothetical protein